MNHSLAAGLEKSSIALLPFHQLTIAGSPGCSMKKAFFFASARYTSQSGLTKGHTQTITLKPSPCSSRIMACGSGKRPGWKVHLP